MIVRDFSKDYLDLLNQPSIQSYFISEKLRRDRIFSDQIFVYVDASTKSRYILLITCRQCDDTVKKLLVLRTGKLSIKLEFEFEQMRELAFPKSNALILIIKLRTGEDLMIETFRRFEVNRFIQQVCSERLINQISLKEADM